MSKNKKKSRKRNKQNRNKGALDISLSKKLQGALNTHQAGDLQSAEDAYTTILKTSPNNPYALHYLGVLCYQQKQYKEAQALVHKSIIIKPDYDEALANYGLLLRDVGMLEDAEAALKKAISINENNGVAYHNLAMVLQDRGQLSEALEHCNKSLKINPKNTTSLNRLGLICKELGNIREAKECFEKAIELQSSFGFAYSNLGVMLNESGFTPEGIPLLKKASELQPENAEMHSNLIFHMNYNIHTSNQEIYLESIKWFERYGAQSFYVPEIVKTRDIRKRLRIGYVSSDFRKHSVSYFFIPLLKHFNRNEVEVFCYSNSLHDDDFTSLIKKLTDNWTLIYGKTDEEVVTSILQDEIDILVDLGGHTNGGRLKIFSWRIAPLQFTWLGYPNTTGVRCMDYRISDEVTDPIGEQGKYYSEKLVRLQEGFLCYDPVEKAPQISMPPCFDNRYITFGSFNTLAKNSSEVIQVWAALLKKVPHSRLLLKNKQLEDEFVKEKWWNLFEKEGLERSRILLTGYIKDNFSHLDLYNKVDICLDPFPYNGTTTTCEALLMGVPVITLHGEFHVSRVGASILHQVGLQELIAESQEEYIERAMKLAGDKKRLQYYRQFLRDNLLESNLCDAKRFTKNMEDLFRNLWNSWCEGNGRVEDESSQTLDIDALLSEGERLFEKGYVEEAKELFIIASQVDPSNAIVYNNLGVVFWQMGNSSQAKNCFIQTLQIDPENSFALENLKAMEG
ncbi:MAG: tetratricopeptide repeat protein [Bacteroidetes bacterium]|nr:tetratricopeptide repeat protein [Bacteroidota bacterium]